MPYITWKKSPMAAKYNVKDNHDNHELSNTAASFFRPYHLKNLSQINPPTTILAIYFSKEKQQ